MSWEGTVCACGGVKERESLLCRECEEAFRHTPEMRMYLHPGSRWQSRRNAAILLLALARRRPRAWAGVVNRIEGLATEGTENTKERIGDEAE